MSLRVIPYRLPFARPLRTRRGVLRRRRGWLLEVRAGERVGWGDAACWPGFGASPCQVRAGLRTLLARDEPLDLEALDLEHWARGLSGPARHAAACAALDLRAQAAGLSLARWLDPQAHTHARSHALVGSVAEARHAAAEGATAFKLKLGGRPLAVDLQRLRELREAVGSAAALRVDANGAWTRVEAEALWPVLGELEVDFVEQPLAADDLAGLRALRGRGVGVAADESLALYGPQAVLDAEAADVWILKPQALGGPDRALAAGRVALRAGLRPVVTHALDSVVGRTAALHVACALAQDHAHGLGAPFAHDVAPAPSEPARAVGPGLGVAPLALTLRFPRTLVEVGS